MAPLPLYGASMAYSESQKKIAAALLKNPQTLEELNAASLLPMDELQREIKALLGLKVIEKLDGFPTRYSLKTNIVSEMQRRQQLAENDKNMVRIHAIIETHAVEPEILKKQTSKLAQSIEEDADFIVYAISLAPTLKQEESYSTFIDVNLSVKHFRALVRFMYFYGPSSVEVLRPTKLELDAHDLQEGLMDLTQMIQKYSELLTKLLNRAELEDLNKRLLR